jgi:hypothetical protein
MKNDSDLICYDGALGRMVPGEKTGEYVWHRQPRPTRVAADADADIELEDDTPHAD